MLITVRKNLLFATAVFTSLLFIAMRIGAQTQTPTPTALTNAQVQALIQLLQAQQASAPKTLTPAQAQALAQYLASQSQSGAPTALSAAQSQMLLQALSAQGRAATVPTGQAFLQNPVQSAGLVAQVPLGPKKPGVVRIGVVEPKAQMGQGNSGINVAEPIRSTIMQYLSGPSLEVIPLAAMLSSQIDAEAKAKDCDYVLYSAISQKTKGGAMSFLKKAGPLTSMIPMVGMAGSMTGAMAGAAAGTAASSVAGTVKAKSEVTFGYQLAVPGNTTAVLANTEKAKAKQDGEDVITPLIEQAATAIVAQVTKPKK